jgi:catechol 2,3-dioxygenase-like lactoylglutathione lyase family enzyme
MIPASTPALPAGFLGKRVQLAFVVSDLDKALRYWTEVLGIGPFVVIESSKGDRRVVHRGRETHADMTLCFAYVGDIQIEIVHQTNDGPSTYKEFTDRGQEGFHHVAFWPENFEAACVHLEASGFVETTSFYMPDGTRNVAYYETPGSVGALVEIVPMTPARTAYFSRIRRLSELWDGKTRPVRRFADRAAFLASEEGTE